MRLPPPAVFLARLLFLAFCILSCGYCLLAYIPFTYQQIHVGGLLPWLNVFVRFHPLFYWIAFALAVSTIASELRARPVRILALGYAIAALNGGVALLIRPALANLRNDETSAMWAVIWLLPAVGLGALDLHGEFSKLRWSGGENEDSRLFPAVWQSGLLLAALNCVAALIRMRGRNGSGMTFPQTVWVLVAGLSSELLLWMTIFCLLELALFVASKTEVKIKASFVASMLAMWGLGWLVLRTMIFPTLSLSGVWNWVLSIAVPGTVAIYFAGTSVRLSGARDETVESGIGLLLEPFRFIERTAWWKTVCWLVGIGGIGWYLSHKASLMDWDFLIQKTMVTILGSLLFAVFYFANSRKRDVSPAVPYVIGFGLLLAYLTVGALEPKVTHAADGLPPTTRLLDRYADYDVAFRMADDLLTQPRVGTRHSGTHENFYAFLAENTHIPRSRPVAPVDVKFVKSFVPATTRPNIFVFVIDSLRRDYVGAYNGDATFTPAMNAFAAESVVFRNAFTRYGGTGLSEPSIWLGGLMLHKQYITPFAPMNALQKLLDAEQYQQYVSKDTILKTVVAPSPAISELDEHIGTMNYEFCSTLAELSEKLAARKDDRPVFAYTQPQNIHVSVIDHEGRSVPPNENAKAGFDAAYASRVRRMDGCFGKFVQDLKQRGMYDNSIIVLTSDHGDFLGENGQWGHAYSLAPEIVRVPLIVHLPGDTTRRVRVDASAVAFTTDITPSLYQLLGQVPLATNGVYGRSLFATSNDTRAQDSYLLASSYAPVYGLLMSNGHLLYVADGVNYTDAAYEIGSDGASAQIMVTPELRKKGQQGISDQVNEIAHFYHLR